MNNRECVIAVLTAHREARNWSDESVADDLLAQLDVKPDAEAKKARPVVNQDMVSEDEVAAVEAAAKQAADKAKEARDALNAQKAKEAQDKADDAAEQARAQKEAADAAKARADSPKPAPIVSKPTEAPRPAMDPSADAREKLEVQMSRMPPQEPAQPQPVVKPE